MIELMFSAETPIVTGFIALVIFVLAFYQAALNPGKDVNRWSAFYTFIFGMTASATILAQRVTSQDEVAAAYAVLAALMPAVSMAGLAALLRFVLPEYIEGPRRVLWVGLLTFIFLPAVFTIFDSLYGLNLYYTGLRPDFDLRSLLPWTATAQGGFAPFIVIGASYIMPAVAVFALLIVLQTSRSITPRQRNTARWLLVNQLLALIVLLGGSALYLNAWAILGVSFIYAITYAVIIFRDQQVIEQPNPGRLQPRLILLVLSITLPTFIFLAVITVDQTRQLLVQSASQRLQEAGDGLVSNVAQWLDLHTRTLQSLARQPDIVSMNPTLQEPSIEAFADNYPYMTLVSTIGLNGLSITRSDGQETYDYSSLEWFQATRSGSPAAYQMIIDPVTIKPALVVATPIKEFITQISGVAMFTADLDPIVQMANLAAVGQTGYAYVIDDQNRLVAHPELMGGDLSMTALQNATPVQVLRTGVSGQLDYTDPEGVRWKAYTATLPNGWAVVVQQQEAEFLTPANDFQTLEIWVILFGSVLLLVLIALAMRQAFAPIDALTSVVQTVTGGDLQQQADVLSDDEIGVLAQSFNQMTAQLRNSFYNLESSVAARTRDLQRRNTQLHSAAEVTRLISSVRDQEELLNTVTGLISENFGFYHVGIFLLDENKQFAVLRAANSEGGKRMLARGHRLEVGRQGLVGYVTRFKEPRLALNVGQDSVHFNNPDLPLTQSEVALPLMVAGDILGALDVQSDQTAAFSAQDLETLQVLADQVAIALQNTLLLRQTELLLESERRSFRQLSQEAWGEVAARLKNLHVQRNPDGLVTRVSPPEGVLPNQAIIDSSNPHRLSVPVVFQGLKLGALQLTKPATDEPWTPEEVRLMSTIGEQLGNALESARTHQETRLTAERQRVTSEISAALRQSLDLDTILKTTVSELRNSFGYPEVSIQLSAIDAGPTSADASNAKPAHNGRKNGKSNGHKTTGSDESSPNQDVQAG